MLARQVLRTLTAAIPLTEQTVASATVACCRLQAHSEAGFSGRTNEQTFVQWHPVRWMSKNKDSVLNTKAHPLTHARAVVVPRDQSFVQRLLLRVTGYYTREAHVIRGAQNQLDACIEQVSSPAFCEAMQFPKDFSGTYMPMCLHVWLLLVRLRTEGSEGRKQAQIFYELFTEQVTRMVHEAGVKVRVVKQLQELEKMFYGSSMAYDEALKGKEALCDALLRNVYNNDPASKAAAARLERYVIRELQCLNMTGGEDITTGQFQFTSFGPPAERRTTHASAHDVRADAHAATTAAP